jgi:hypothetical protein
MSYLKANFPANATKAVHMHKVPYCKAIESLMYTSVAICPNIMFTVSTLSQFLENPGKAYWEVVK